MKTGTKTTEFNITWLMSAVTGGYGLTSDSEIVQACALIAIGFMGGMYMLSRGMAKRSQV